MNKPLFNHAALTMRKGSKSFDAAARLFDPKTRRSVLMLYTWCRHCDDVIDNQIAGFTANAPASVTPEQQLERLRDATLAVYQGHTPTEPAFAALQEVTMHHHIPAEWPLAHLDGFAMDVRGERYTSLDDTLRYCYHVAGVVGLMMAHIMGVRDAKVLDRACDLGLAFQLTNIARDVIEDAQAGRCYLPATWLAQEGLTAKSFALPEHRPALFRVVKRLLVAAEPYYDSALAGLPALPLRSRWAIATARDVYRAIGIKVAHAGARAWDRRQHTTKPEKLMLLLKGAGRAAIAPVVAPSARPASLWQRPL
ncbi:15-cis-phytoene synthase CrtB [Atlantibacter sp.]|uniref:15-cis-phytoene synthase CrtB n=1 Tax=Atlantibacter sp. TaxID=1903473 RepID=UPI0028A057B4|nr:15-cis-phytoene synthase CrtB [Atlantibacter sp.]